MNERSELTPREEEILGSVVHTYINTGRPVASRSISRLKRHELSPASIRNVMADLADGGYLEQPHTSAGRIPTAKAFQIFVRTLTAKQFLEEDLDLLREKLSEVATVAGRVERSSHLLTELTRSFGIAAAIPTDSQTLDQVELLALADGRILMVMVTRDKMVRNRVISLNESVTQGELDSIRNYINHNFSGCVLSEVRKRLKVRLEQANAAYDAILRKLVVLCKNGLLDLDPGPEVHMEGASNLLGVDFHLTREKMKELFRTLEEKKRVLEILDQFLEVPDGQVSVRIGLAEAHPCMKELSLIGVSVILPSGLAAKVAVLGPMRMNYRRVMSSVLHVSQAFQSIPV